MTCGCIFFQNIFGPPLSAELIGTPTLHTVWRFIKLIYILEIHIMVNVTQAILFLVVIFNKLRRCEKINQIALHCCRGISGSNISTVDEPSLVNLFIFF